MATVSDRLQPRLRLALAVRTRPPGQLARTFAGLVGAFYDRAPFDALAREAHALYAVRDEAQASCFRARLDGRLRERDRPPVRWDGAPGPEQAGA